MSSVSPLLSDTPGVMRTMTRFTPAFEIDPNGDLRLEMENVGSFERVELPQLAN